VVATFVCWQKILIIMLTESIDKTASEARAAKKNKQRFMENNARLTALNKAYYFGEFDLSEYRHLRDQLIDELTKSDIDADTTQRMQTPQQSQTMKLNQNKAQAVAMKSIIPPSEQIGSQSGPSVLQFLWVSVAVILFIYMYTATID